MQIVSNAKQLIIALRIFFSSNASICKLIQIPDDLYLCLLFAFSSKWLEHLSGFLIN